MRYQNLMEASGVSPDMFDNTKKGLGEVKFLTSQQADAHIQKAVKIALQQLAKAGNPMTEQELWDHILSHKDYTFLQHAKTVSPILYDTIALNAIESGVFKMMQGMPVDNAPQFRGLYFNMIVDDIAKRHKPFMQLHNWVDKKVVSNPQFLPSTAPGLPPSLAATDTACATPDGVFVFNTQFMQDLLNYAFIKGLKPKSKIFKSNGGQIPDEYAYIEFLILHELMHFKHADFHYMAKLKADPQIINYVGDFRSNFLLVKSGFEQLPIGLFSDHVNYDRQSTYKEMYDLVKSEMDKFKDKDKDKLKQMMDDMTDEHQHKEGEGQEGEGQDGQDGQDGEGQEGEGKDQGGDQEGEDGEGGEEGKDGKSGNGKQKGKGKGKGKGGEGKEGEEGEEPGDGEGGEGKDQGKEKGKGKDKGKGGAGDEEGEGDKGKGKGKGKNGKPGQGQPGDGQGQGSGGDMSDEDLWNELDKAHKKISDGMGKAGEEIFKNNKHSSQAGGGGGRGLGDGQQRDISDNEPRHPINWRVLIKKMVSTAVVTDPQNTYSKMHRNAAGTITVAKTTGSAGIQPGERDEEEQRLKIAFIVDSSGSMGHLLSTINNNISMALKTGGSQITPEFMLIRFSSQSNSYACNSKLKKGVEASAGEYVKGKVNFKKNTLPLDTIFKKAEGGSTNYTSEMTAMAKTLATAGFNVMMFTDTDVLYGENLANVQGTINACGKRFFMVLDSWDTYKKVAAEMPAISNQISCM